jgi:hypothetical protein
MRTGWRPRRWGGLVVGVVVGALVLAACLPPPPPAPPPYASEYCAPAVPTTPSAYQAAFDGLRNGNVEWLASDGGSPTVLPDGRVIWLFGDTFTGRVQSDGSLAPGFGLVRNSAVVQSGACFSPLMGGSPDARTSLIPAPSGQWYWPTTGVVEGNALRVFLFRMTTGNTPGPFNFRNIDMQMATFSLPDLRLLGVQALPNGISSDAGTQWGASTFIAGSTVYVFANGSGNPNNTDALADRNRRVARTTIGSLATGPWQFYNGGTTGTNADWSNDPSAAAFLTFTADSPPLPSGAPSAKPWDWLFVTPRQAGGYLAVGKLGELPEPNSLFGTEISGWTAPTPQGPWHYAGKVSQTSPLTNQFTYGARLDRLPGSAPMVHYSINSFDDVTQNIALYGVKFVAPSTLP